MVYNTQNYWVFGLFPSSGNLENTTFRKNTLTQMGPLERANPNHWTPHKLDDECQPVSCFLHSRNELQTAAGFSIFLNIVNTHDDA
jgi:hypothetical protein